LLAVSLKEREIREVVGAPPVSDSGDDEIVAIATLAERQDRALYFLNRPVSDAILQELAQLQGCVFLAKAGLDTYGLAQRNSVLENPNPRLAIARVLLFVEENGRCRRSQRDREISCDARISPLAAVEGCVHIAAGVRVEPFCLIGDGVALGQGTIVRTGARLIGDVTVGEGCVIGANAVIGGGGFGIDRDEQGRNVRVPQLGGVRIGSQVEIGALSTVCSGTIGPTAIADHVKIDDHVHVAHNARVGRNCVITAGVVIGGSATVGEDTWIGLQAIIRDGISVGNGCLLGMGVMVSETLPDNAIVAGSPSRAVVAPRALGWTLLRVSNSRDDE